MRLLYKTAVMYGAETWAVKKAQEKKFGCGRNKDVEMDMWSHKAGQNMD